MKTFLLLNLLFIHTLFARVDCLSLFDGSASYKKALNLVPTAQIGAGDVLVDTNIFISLLKNEQVENVPQVFRDRYADFTKKNEIPSTNIFVTNNSIAEVLQLEDEFFKYRPSSVKRVRTKKFQEKNLDYIDLIKHLEKYNVGGRKGSVDRKILADFIFAQNKNTNHVLNFYSSDHGVYSGLCHMSPACHAQMLKTGRGAIELFPQGFLIELPGEHKTLKKVMVHPVK